jgi:hypothetical protein
VFEKIAGDDLMTPPESVTDDYAVGWQFDNTYSRLPTPFFAPALLVTVRKPSS